MEERRTEARGESRADAFAPAPEGAADEISPVRVHSLRTIVQRSLDGDEDVSGDIERLALSIADAARADGHAPERLLIGVRALWRELGLSQGDRLQVATVYDELVRTCIERYYDDGSGDGGGQDGTSAQDGLAD
jgi:hypothetical protein